ncbi:hypothetical protein [Chroococcidiopsis sp. CCMEE 29]|uniref:hypothetical protein n=1 Tax=Chroococcidiopsis sp. CCMEE 29 TaxID=155894 RepID=UPI002021CC74|nr:hypothetical protein [Chroococcidiopsis sp. CCMEE 29]
MNQRDGFTGGFIAGTLVGGVVGGIIGALLTQRTNELAVDAEPRSNASLSNASESKKRRRQFKAASPEQSIEMARRSLEDKIAQLNETIDEVRMTLGEVNGTQPEGKTERSLTQES